MSKGFKDNTAVSLLDFGLSSQNAWVEQGKPMAREFTDLELRVLEKEEIECSDVYTLLGEYVDEELPPTLHGRIADHIADCEPCQDFEAEYREVIELAGELKDKPIPSDVQKRLRKGLNERLGINLPL